jgi:hypothetical protein
VVLPCPFNLNRVLLASRRNFESASPPQKKEQQKDHRPSPNQIIQPGNISMEGPYDFETAINKMLIRSAIG